MKRAVAICLTVFMLLFTYGLFSTTWRVIDGQLGHSKFDAGILFFGWLILVTAWCLVLWMYERKPQ